MKNNWQTKKLSDVLKLEYGKPLDDLRRKFDGKYVVYGANGEKDRTDDFYYDKPSIIVGRKGSAGELRLTNNRFWPLDVTFFVTFEDEKYDLKFLYYLLLNLKLPSFAKGVKPGINRNEIYSIEVSIPIFGEQKRIVKALDKAFERIKKVKENTEKNLQNSKEFFESYLNDVLSNRKRGWETRVLGDVTDLINRGISPKYVEEEGVQVLNQRCIRNHVINYSFSRKHNAKHKKISADKYIRIGDVLVNSTGVGTLGRVAQVVDLPEPTTVDSHVTIVRPKEDLFFNQFFGYTMIFIEKEISKKGEGASGQIELSRDTLKKDFVISYPESIQEQRSIVKKLDQLSEKTQKLEFLYKQKLKSIEELKKSILSKAFSGEL